MTRLHVALIAAVTLTGTSCLDHAGIDSADPGGGGTSGGLPGRGGAGGGSGGATGNNPRSGGSAGGPIACPAIGCANECPYGYVKDASGCPSCTCATEPPACPEVACLLYCPNGFAKDPATGCDLCACNPPSACPAIACDVFCPYGNRKDSNGCELCACNPPPPGTQCGAIRDATTCNIQKACAWLEPGCSDPKLPAAGCYDRGDLNCASAADCTNNRQCLKRMVNPCAPSEPSDPNGVSACAACAMPIAICL